MNHPGCSCTFVKNVAIKTARISNLEKNKMYKAEVWSTPGGIDYLRVDHKGDPTVYMRLSLEDVDEINNV